MKKLGYVITSNRGILLLTLVYILLYTFSLERFPGAKMDESWFSNPAYELIRSGKLATTMLTGWRNMENYTFWQPPVYLLLLAGSFKLFGLSLISARIVGVVLGLVCLVFAYRLALELYDRRMAVLASLLLITNPVFFAMARVARMEIAVTAFLTVALYFIVTAIRHSRPFHYVLCGVFAMLAMLSHPNGLLGIISIYLILLGVTISRSGPLIGRIRAVLTERGFYLYSGGLVLMILPYLLYVSQDLVAFREQLGTPVQGYFSRMAENVLTEPSRYASAAREFVSGGGVVRLAGLLAIALFGVLTALALYRAARRGLWGDRIILIFLVTHAVLFTLIVSNKTNIYFCILVPGWSLLASAVVSERFGQGLTRLKGISLASLAIGIIILGHVLANVGAVGYVLYSSWDYDYYRVREAVTQYIPRGSTVIGETTYWMALADDYRYYDYRVLMLVGPQRFDETLKNLAPDFILYDDQWATGRYMKESDRRYAAQTERFIARNCTRVGTIPEDKSIAYGPISVYRVDRKD